MYVTLINKLKIQYSRWPIIILYSILKSITDSYPSTVIVFGRTLYIGLLGSLITFIWVGIFLSFLYLLFIYVWRLHAKFSGTPTRIYVYRFLAAGLLVCIWMGISILFITDQETGQFVWWARYLPYGDGTINRLNRLIENEQLYITLGVVCFFLWHTIILILRSTMGCINYLKK